MNHEKNTKRSADLDEELFRLPREERLEFIHAWELVGQAAAPAPDVPGLDEAWNDLQRRINEGRSPRSARRDRKPRRSTSLRRRRLLTGGVLLTAVAVLTWMWQIPVTAVAPAGQLSTVDLADGSTVHLNSGTRLTYRPRTLPGTANLQRSVRLDGEAFFDVAPAEQAFLVETASAVVEVLGTRFNIRARSEVGDESTEVTLASGRVRVSERRDPTRAVLLTRPGEHVHVGRSSGADSILVSDAAPLDYVLAWRRNAFAAIDRPVGSIIAELERRHAMNIDVEDGVEMHHSMTLLYGPNTSAERILHDVCLVQGCRYRPTTRGFAVFMPAENSNSL